MTKGVFVYRNLSRPGVVWSIKSNRTGRIIARKRYVIIKNAELKVSKAGNARVLKERRKNVHAGIKGTQVLVGFNPYIYDYHKTLPGWEKIIYNPHSAASFTKLDGTKVTKAKLVILSEDGAFAFEPE